MGSIDSIPVVSQTKSLVQAVCGDTKGAEQTQKNFLNECIVFSQSKSAIEYFVLKDEEAAQKTQIQYVKGCSNFVDGLPVVGHVKGSIHYLCKDQEGGDNAMRASSRSVGVVGGALIGCLGGTYSL